jgi:hypothetical protein
MSDDEVIDWEGHQRSDGAAVVVTDEGHWIALVPGMAPVILCPCCQKPFPTARAAKRVCNAVRPLMSDKPAREA